MADRVIDGVEDRIICVAVVIAVQLQDALGQR